jgi:alpha-1,2-mannosyltransferase
MAGIVPPRLSCGKVICAAEDSGAFHRANSRGRPRARFVNSQRRRSGADRSMNPDPVSTADAASTKHGGRILLWVFIFAYLPFMFAYGIEAWPRPSVDFPPLYFATKVVFEEHRVPYGDDAFAAQALTLGRWVPPFLYPPPSLLILWPLHFFDYDTGKAVLLAVNHLCIIFATWFILRRLFRGEFDGTATPVAGALAIVYIMLFDPSVVTLHLGQVNFLLLVCLCLTWHALRRNAHAVAIAVPLSLAILIKTYPLALLPLLVFRRRYAAVAWTLGLFGLYCIASYVLLPQNIWADWLQKAAPGGAEAHAGPWNQNIRAFVARAFLPNPFSEPLVASPAIVKPLIAVLSLATVGVTMLIGARSWYRRVAPSAIDAEFSLFLLMMFLIAPVSWEHHFVYLLPSLVLVILMLLRGHIRGHWRWIAALSLCLIAWRIPIIDPRLTSGWWTLLISAKFYPAVALFVFFVFETLRADRVEVAPFIASPDEKARLSATLP